MDPPFNTCVIDSPIGLSLVTAIRNSSLPEEFAVAADNVSVDACQIRINTEAGAIFRAFSLTEEKFGICKSILVDWIDLSGGCPNP